MSNEILLILSIFIIYGSVIVMYKLFGKQGLFCFTSIATIAANIEVLIMVKAFGMVMICPLSSRQVKYLKISTDYTYILIEM